MRRHYRLRKGTQMRATIVLFAALLFGTNSLPAIAANEKVERDAPSSQEAIDGFAAELLADPDVPAFGLAVLSCRSINMRMDGVRRVDETGKISSAARFNIGSNAKSMLASVAARLHDRKRVSLDATIADLWPEAATMHPDKANITLAQLLSHSSGLPAFDRGKDLDRVPVSASAPEGMRREAAEWLLSQPLFAPPGQETLYSNAGYIIAGHLLERATGLSVIALLEKEVFAPLGLDAELGEPRRMAGGQPFGHYMGAQGIAVYDDLDPPIPPFLEAAGNVSITPLSYARYLQAHLCALNGETDYLTSETAQRVHRSVQDGGSGLGWGITELNGSRVSFHIGGTGDFTAYAAISGNQDRAALAILSVGGEPASIAQPWLISAITSGSGE